MTNSYEQKFVEYCLDKINLQINEEQLNLLRKYEDLLINENKKYNLTAITEKDEI